MIDRRCPPTIHLSADEIGISLESRARDQQLYGRQPPAEFSRTACQAPFAKRSEGVRFP